MKLNDNKMDVLILTSTRYPDAVTDNDVSILSSQFVRSIGVRFEQTLDMKQFMTHMCKSSFIQM